MGVAYGSDTRLVEETLLGLVADNNKFLKYPEPMVLFNEFGPSSLDFSFFVWVKVYEPKQKFKMESELRHKIVEDFAEKGLVISFPQRDVHLYSDKPIKVDIEGKS